MGDRVKRVKKLTRDRIKLDLEASGDSEMGRARSDHAAGTSKDGKEPKRKRPSKERWLLTRKTWRYMADAGRRLIPDGAHNRPEDLPKIEAYFQEVCQKETRFLLWRKSSYPGALGFRSHRKKRERKKGGSCREKASSADEAEEAKKAGAFALQSTSGGRFDIQKMRQEFLKGGPTALSSVNDQFQKHKFFKHVSDQRGHLPDVPEVPGAQTGETSTEEDKEEVISTLLTLLDVEETSDSKEQTRSVRSGELDYEKLYDKLTRYLSTLTDSTETTDEQLYELDNSDIYFNQNSFNEPEKTISHNEKRVVSHEIGSSSSQQEDLISARAKGKSSQRNISETRHADSKISGMGTREGRDKKSSSNIGPLLLDTSRVSSGFRGIHRTLHAPENVQFDGDHIQRRLLETLSRYYSKSTNREKVISDLLTNRKVLEKLHFDLRQARGFKGRRVTSLCGNSTSQWKTTEPTTNIQLRHVEEKPIVTEEDEESDEYDEPQIGSWKRLGKPAPRRPRDLKPLSPLPLIEVQPEAEASHFDKAIQTEVVPPHIISAIEEELRKERNKEESEEKEPKSPPLTTRRRSSVDHDDVSPSVSDTIKRYLRMARKKSLDAEKVDRFKRVNYDRNLRNIKPKGDKMGEDDGLNKGCQTDESWISAIKELKLQDVPVASDTETTSPVMDDYSGSRVTSSRSSFDGGTCDEALLSPPVQVYGKTPGIISSGQSFLSNLLHGLHHNQQQQLQQNNATSQPTTPVVSAAGVAMQKSKSSSSVMHHGSRLVAKKIWRARSKSQSRATSSTTSTWTPQGNCTWTSVTGRQVVLSDTNLLQLTEVERRVLQKVALAKLQALNLGCIVRIPNESVGASVSHKPKRRAHLLKKKALTTGFFDTARGKDGDKEKDGIAPGTGLVFGIPISQCLENDRLVRVNRGGSPFRSRSDAEDSTELRRKAHHGSRSSFSSLIETARAEESGSCESLMSPTERMAGSVPGLLDTLSYGSAVDLSDLSEAPPGVPQLVSSCFKYLENNGLHTLGIFRVSSSKKRVRQLREDFDCGKETALEDDVSPHDVATLLKEFFRDLPEPLLCRDLYMPFIQTQRIRNRRLQYEALQHLIQLLPVPNRDTLCSLLTFLAIVAKNSQDHENEKGEWVTGNKMDSNNLATLFAPNILHCIKPGNNKDVVHDKAEERMDVINVIRTMIDQNQELFKVSAELLDEVYIHMMDTHPEALDYLLNRRDNATEELIVDDGESSTTEGECYSVPRTPTSLSGDIAKDTSESEEYQKRRVWSREEFLHESAATGGPNIGMKPRHKDRDRGRERGSKKRLREDGGRGSGPDLEGSDSSRLTSNSSITGSLSTSQISSVIGRHRIERVTSQTAVFSEESSQKTRSASVDSGNATSTTVLSETSEQQSTRTLKMTEEEIRRRKSSPTVDGNGVITASLKIPVPSTNATAFSLNLDDSDIPFIEDGTGYSITSEGRQQMMISLVRATAGTSTNTTTLMKNRQRTTSGSDSSQASIALQQHDSALSSFNSPARNTTPSVCSSSGGEAGPFSSPPSWASTPPTSPDSNITTVDYIPEISQSSRKTVTKTLQQQQKGVTLMTKEITPVVLQKVTFMSTSNLKQQAQRESVHHVSVSHSGEEGKVKNRLKPCLSPPMGDLPKSASTSSVTSHKKTVEFESDVRLKESERKPATSITSIGGAVMRSKTEDIERMLKIEKTERLSSLSRAPIIPTISKTVQDETKKYTKRRYTDSRHQTQHIPDSDSLQTTSSSNIPGQSASASDIRQRRSQQHIQVYKRRELIASDPKDHETFL